MPTLTVTEARSSLYQLVDSVADSHEPVLITGKRTNAVLISEEDWRPRMRFPQPRSVLLGRWHR